MKQILTVFRFTFLDGIRKKAFIISTVIMAALIIILFALPALLDSSDNSAAPEIGTAESVQIEKSRPYTAYYIDQNGLIPGAVETLSAAFGNTRFIAGDTASIEDYRAEIAEDSDISLVEVVPGGDMPFVSVVTKDFMSGLNAQNVARTLSGLYVADALSQYNLPEEALALARAQLPYGASVAGTMNVSGYALGLALIMLIFFAVYFYGYGVSMSVANEKTSRVMETLVVSAKPSRILLGKCLAMGLVGLMQFAGMLLLAFGCYTLFVPEGATLFGMPLSLDAFTTRSALLILVYFILGYALYAMMNAVCGATVSKIEDLNSAMMPAMFVALGGFYLAYFAMVAGSGGALEKLAIYLPFSSPFAMPFKLLNGVVPTQEVLISIALLIVATVLVSLLSIKLYSASVLHYGKRLKYKELYKTKL